MTAVFFSPSYLRWKYAIPLMNFEVTTIRTRKVGFHETATASLVLSVPKRSVSKSKFTSY